jgi:hypothetical protein
MSNETTSVRPLTIAAEVPIRTNRDSPPEGSAPEGALIFCCWVCCVSSSSSPPFR